MNSVAASDSDLTASPSRSKSLIRFFSQLLVAAVLLYLISRYLIYWQDWPSLSDAIASLSGGESDLNEAQKTKGGFLLLGYLATFFAIAFMVKRSPETSLSYDAKKFKGWAYFVIRAAFWSVFLVGTADALISMLRVENILTPLAGEKINDFLGLANQRGYSVHYPLIALSLVIAGFTRSLGFIWLTFLVVMAEFSIVITRFVFSYEQAYMGDLVRFWYAALFLFASAYTLMEGGHVRVDVLYARMANRKKAWVNALGSLLLGLPVCWTILHYGMGTQQSSLIAPILSFEVSQSGYGMYVKYLMGGFLIVYAVSMALSFISYFLSSCAYLYREPDAEMPSGGEH
jgi:TRAP-type mannitol/chloroaromatic compound transport system permease small subunit